MPIVSPSEARRDREREEEEEEQPDIFNGFERDMNKFLGGRSDDEEDYDKEAWEEDVEDGGVNNNGESEESTKIGGTSTCANNNLFYYPQDPNPLYHNGMLHFNSFFLFVYPFLFSFVNIM